MSTSGSVSSGRVSSGSVASGIVSEEDMPQQMEPADITEKKQTDDDSCPDGGVEAWLVVLGAWCALFGSFGVFNCVGILQALVEHPSIVELHFGQYFLDFATYSFFYHFCGVQIGMGPIFDAYGLKPLIIAGSVGFMSSLMLFSLCQEYYQFFLCFSVLNGISSSMLFTPSIAAVNHWFYARRGLVSGLCWTGGGIGGVIFPIVFRALIPRVGFAWSVRIVGFICLVSCLLSILLLRTRLPPNKAGSGTVDFRAFKERPFVFTTAAIFLLEWAHMIPITYFPSFAVSKGGVGASFSYQFLAIMNSASGFGRWVPGYMADCWDRFNMMVVTTSACAIFAIAFWTSSAAMSEANFPLMITFMILYGFSSGTGVSLTPVFVAQICETKDYGKRYGTAYSFASIAALTGVPIAGQILKTQNGSYVGLAAFCGSCYIGSMICFALAKATSTGQKFLGIY
ncbi:major facilitator superfamily domain-containing protein [Lipomyces tetrasporus]